MDNKKIINILDIDLDFFLNKRHTGYFEENERLCPNEYIPWSKEQVSNFLEKNCGLSLKNKITGKNFIHHDEVYYFLTALQEEHCFSLDFSIDHVDAHADLGMGDSSYIYISTDVLHRNLTERPFQLNTNGSQGLSKGNFLAFLLANRWLTDLTYINKADQMNDVPSFVLKNFNDRNFLQLKKYNDEHIKEISRKGFNVESLQKVIPIELEPEIQFNCIDYSSFLSKKKYDLIFLTQSPNYTPVTSDALIEIINDYMLMEKK